jgi:hypothetical protein
MGTPSQPNSAQPLVPPRDRDRTITAQRADHVRSRQLTLREQIQALFASPRRM